MWFSQRKGKDWLRLKKKTPKFEGFNIIKKGELIQIKLLKKKLGGFAFRKPLFAFSVETTVNHIHVEYNMWKR